MRIVSVSTGSAAALTQLTAGFAEHAFGSTLHVDQAPGDPFRRKLELGAESVEPTAILDADLLFRNKPDLAPIEDALGRGHIAMVRNPAIYHTAVGGGIPPFNSGLIFCGAKTQDIFVKALKLYDAESERPYKEERALNQAAAGRVHELPANYNHQVSIDTIGDTDVAWHFMGPLPVKLQGLHQTLHGLRTGAMPDGTGHIEWLRRQSQA